MKNKILFVSTLCSPKVFDYVFNTLTEKSGNSIQKFHGLLLDGLASNKTNIVETLSLIPVSPINHKKRFWTVKSDVYNNIKFNYVPVINLPFIKTCFVFFYSFLKVLFWKFPKSSGQKIVVCDILKLSISSGAFLASKIRRIKVIGIVTDMPGLDVFKPSIIRSLNSRLILSYATKCDGYILITKYMDETINPLKKPSLVMEGLVDNSLVSSNNTLENKSKERVLIYAGGIYERYGIKSLINAFMRLKSEDLRLFIYGGGPMASEMTNYMMMDARIKYMGVVSNEEVVAAQMKATLLINPRPSFEDYTKYSFPSKNMEYMVSGTPIVTTLLPGMPNDYLPYIYSFKEENETGIYDTLNELLTKPRKELHEFGLKSKEFVLLNKNNILQAERVTKFMSGFAKQSLSE